ncbi:MAG: hypothetical protein HY851_03250 [candidate division Zixibacteria bacterium]|nr:hypothetical protein [candidate division Zixibacteria bacterium]
MSPARFRWGMILIFMGTLILLVNLRVLNNNIWENLLFYSPLVLIAIGIEKIFTRSRLEFISYASSVLLISAGLYIAFQGGIGGREFDYWSDTDGRVQDTPGLRALNASINLDEQNLSIRDVTEDLAEWRFRKFTRKPTVDYSRVNDTGVIVVDCRKGGLWGGILKVDIDERNEWNMAFSQVIPLILNCSGEKSSVDLDLSDTPLRKLKLDISDGRMYVVLGKNEPQVDLEASGQDANFRLRVPNDVGLRVQGVEDADYMRTIGLIERDRDFVTEGYDTLPNKVNVKLDDRFRSLTIEFY